jgi:hypothetical protein
MNNGFYLNSRACNFLYMLWIISNQKSSVVSVEND